MYTVASLKEFLLCGSGKIKYICQKFNGEFCSPQCNSDLVCQDVAVSYVLQAANLGCDKQKPLYCVLCS